MHSAFLAGLLLATEGLAVPALDSRIALVLEADAALKADPVWPGFRLIDQPLAVELSGARSVLVAHPNAPKEFSRLRSHAVPVAIRDGMLPDFKFGWDVDYRVGGISAFAFRWSSTLAGVEDLDTLVHERFHVFQKTAFQRSGSAGSYPEAGPDNLALAALEQRALSKALTATSVSDRLAAGRMFVAIRRIRNDRWGRAIRSIEDWEEQSEGTAEYVTKVLLARPAFRRGEGIGGAAPIIARLEGMPGPTGLGKSRAYGVGAALGFLLDRECVTGWHDSVTAGNPIAELAARAFAVAPSETVAVAAAAKSEFGYAELLESARTALRREAGMLDRLLAQYQGDPGIELRVTTPSVSHSARYSAVGRSYPLPDGSTFRPATAELVIQEPGFSLTVRERPMTFVVDGGGYRFKISSDTRVTLDGRDIGLAAARLKFTRLHMSATGFELTIDLPGLLNVDAAAAAIEWPARR